MWTTDALKSIGMIVPLVSLLLILRAWRSLNWRPQGTWWGLLPLMIAIAAVWIQERAVIIMVISPNWSTPLPPPSLVLFMYGSGAVLLFGGNQLYRAALFPIFLLLLVNPIPHVFSLWVDLPLQQISAHIARAFAMHLGQSLTPDHLRLMFTPDFGMFIAPGCNGIRGSITMGFIALIAGYLYRFRWFANLAVVVVAVLLGYVFNLVRLCLLVLYYLVALHFPFLQSKAENADYVIGALLFLLATFLMFTAIHHLRDLKSVGVLKNAVSSRKSEIADFVLQMQISRIAVMGMVVLFGFAAVARTNAAIRATTTIADKTAEFPLHFGNYTRVRTWNETMTIGSIVYVWAQYAPTDGGTPIAIGVSPVLGWHDPLICHTIRGDHPLWQGPLKVTTGDVVPVSFDSAFYSDGVTQSLEAFTQCTNDSCGEFATERTRFGFVYNRLDSKSLLSKDDPRVVPVLVRAETIDMTLSAGTAREQLTKDLRAFLVSVNLGALTGTS
jgi:exosortase J